MKIFIWSLLLIFISAAWGSEECKEKAQRSVEIREDYSSLRELNSEVNGKLAALNSLVGHVSGIAERVYQLELLKIHGQMAFMFGQNLKGGALYKKTYEWCVAEEKRIADREARRAAREAAKQRKESQ